MPGVKGMKWRASQNPAAMKQLRERIRAGQIIDQLQEHVGGLREMSATQVTAGLGLLRKVIPDAVAIQHSGDPEAPIVVASAQELMAKLRGEYDDPIETPAP